MNCFDGIVGLREIDSTCMYWVNDAVGINTELASYLQNTDNSNLSNFWEMIKTRAWGKFYTNFVISFHEFYANCCKERNEIDTYIQSIICANKSILALSWLNLLCKEILLEKRHSANINYYTTVDLESTNILIDYYVSEFDKTFLSAIKAIYLPENLNMQETGRCFIQTSFSIP